MNHTSVECCCAALVGLTYDRDVAPRPRRRAGVVRTGYVVPRTSPALCVPRSAECVRCGGCGVRGRHCAVSPLLGAEQTATKPCRASQTAAQLRRARLTQVAVSYVCFASSADFSSSARARSSGAAPTAERQRRGDVSALLWHCFAGVLTDVVSREAVRDRARGRSAPCGLHTRCVSSPPRYIPVRCDSRAGDCSGPVRLPDSL